MSEEHKHILEKKFVYDELAHKTIELETCVCGYTKNVRIHH